MAKQTIYNKVNKNEIPYRKKGSAVIAMTGHKDYKLADHYSKLDHEYQRDLSIKIMEEVEKKKRVELEKPDNVIELRR